MKEVGTRKNRKIDITQLLLSKNLVETIEIESPIDYEIKFQSIDLPKEKTFLDKEIKLKFIKHDLKSDIFIRAVLNSKLSLRLKISINAPLNIENCESKLNMKALILEPESEITFVPGLEIDEMNVSVDHKSTIGKPDYEWVNYMMSRGLSMKSVYSIIASSFLN